MNLFYILSIFVASILTQEVKVTHEDHAVSEFGRDSGCFGIGGSPIDSIEVPKDTIVGVFSEEGCRGKFQLIPSTDSGAFVPEDRNVKSFAAAIDQGKAWIEKSAELGKLFNKPSMTTGFGLNSEAPKQDPFNSFSALNNNPDPFEEFSRKSREDVEKQLALDLDSDIQNSDADSSNIPPLA